MGMWKKQLELKHMSTDTEELAHYLLGMALECDGEDEKKLFDSAARLRELEAREVFHVDAEELVSLRRRVAELETDVAIHKNNYEVAAERETELEAELAYFRGAHGELKRRFDSAPPPVRHRECGREALNKFFDSYLVWHEGPGHDG